MSDKSKIEWCDATWNPVTGCTKVSEGCRNCYAMKFAERWRGTPGHYFENGFDLTFRPDKMDQPLKWKRPRRIFVNSMSDLFHVEVPDEFIAEVFAVMSMADQHIFQVLTKRPERMSRLLNSGLFWIMVNAYRMKRGVTVLPGSGPILLPNVWLGTSVENQKAKHRMDILRSVPTTVRFISGEPLIEDLGVLNLEGISWFIVGGESGPGARPMHPAWAQSILDQCQAAGVAFLFKQWGEYVWKPTFADSTGKHKHYFEDGIWVERVGKKVAGRLLDGREWNEFPEVKNG